MQRDLAGFISTVILWQHFPTTAISDSLASVRQRIGSVPGQRHADRLDPIDAGECPMVDNPALDLPAGSQFLAIDQQHRFGAVHSGSDQRSAL